VAPARTWSDLDAAREQRWPALTGALLEPDLSGGRWAARLGARPLLDLMTVDADRQQSPGLEGP
jgi:hypothetical protein